MKQFRKLFAGVIALCMLFTFMPAAMAESEIGSISGDTKLFAPPVGQYSAVTYVLKDANDNVVEDAVFTITGTHTGVSIEGNKLILDGTNIKSNGVAWSSEFKLSATSSDGSVTAGPIDIDIYENRVFVDFENHVAEDGVDGGNVGNMLVLNTGNRGGALFQVYNTYYSGDKARIKASTAGNKYLYADDDAYVRFKPDWAAYMNTTGAQNVTIQTKMMKHGEYTGNSTFNYISGNGIHLRYTVGNTNHTDLEMLNRYAEDGTSLSADTYVSSGYVPTGAWADLRIELDYRNKVYSVYVNDSVVFEKYKMPTLTNYHLDTALDIYTPIDEFAVYSGTRYVPEVPYEIEGTGSIYLPTEKAAAVPFVLKNKSDGSVVSDAVYSVSGSGVEMLADGRLLVNGNTPAGTFVISAYSPSDPYQSVATKTVTVQSAKWFYDFEEYNVGADVANTGSAYTAPSPGQVSPNWSATGAVQAETDKDGNIVNKYFGFADGITVGTNESTYYHQLLLLNNKFSNKTTVEFDLIINEATDRWHTVMSAHNGLSITYNNRNLKYSYNKEGNTEDKYFMLDGKGTHHIRMELGYETFSIWVNGKLWLDDYKYPKSQKGYISQLIWRSCIDNLMLYDGGEYSLTPSAGVELLEIPGTDSNSYTFSSVYSDGAAVSKELTYTLAEEYEGVSLEGNVLTVSNTAEIVPIIVNVTDGFVNGSVEKHVKMDYILVNGEVYTEGEDVINAAGAYTIKAGYGFSNQYASGSMYIAQYEGGKLVKVIPVNHDGETPINLSAVLSENFSETGTARVFIWNGDMSPIKSDVTIQ